MEVERSGEHIYPDEEINRYEGKAIEELKANTKIAIPDPDEWLDVDL